MPPGPAAAAAAVGVTPVGLASTGGSWQGSPAAMTNLRRVVRMQQLEHPQQLVNQSMLHLLGMRFTEGSIKPFTKNHLLSSKISTACQQR
jgi:hypothetical protein